PTAVKGGRTAFYTLGLLSQSNVDIPYVHFQFGMPEKFTATDVMTVFGPMDFVFDLELRTNLRGSPGVANVPWPDLDPVGVRTDDEETAVGYAVGFPAFSYAFQSFSVYVPDGYQGFPKELFIDDPTFGPFPVVATATPLTPEEYIAQQ